jgi:hypothetical protein
MFSPLLVLPPGTYRIFRNCWGVKNKITPINYYKANSLLENPEGISGANRVREIDLISSKLKLQSPCPLLQGGTDKFISFSVLHIL